MCVWLWNVVCGPHRVIGDSSYCKVMQWVPSCHRSIVQCEHSSDWLLPQIVVQCELVINQSVEWMIEWFTYKDGQLFHSCYCWMNQLNEQVNDFLITMVIHLFGFWMTLCLNKSFERMIQWFTYKDKVTCRLLLAYPCNLQKESECSVTVV